MLIASMVGDDAALSLPQKENVIVFSSVFPKKGLRET